MESMELNKQVFRSSRFFVSAPKEAFSGKNPILSGDVVSEETEKISSGDVLENMEKHQVGKLPEEGPVITREFSEERAEFRGKDISRGMDVQEVSDEVERLSQRYGRRMEEWISDQSQI